MFKIHTMWLCAATFLFLHTGFADGRTELQKYFSDMAVKVKQAQDPSAKRSILDKSFNNLSTALDRAKESSLLSTEDRQSLDPLRKSLREKQSELNGFQGYQKVDDAKLDAFADYVVQDSEQAVEYVTISLTALILIVLIVLLIAR